MYFIEELYYGNINPHTKNCYPTTRYKQASEIILKLETKLKDALSEPERTMLERLIEASDEVNVETGMANFKLGFSLGVQMMVDCFSINIDKIFADS